MTRRRIPDEVLTAAHDRAKAREARDWPEADRLRGEIEAAGWKIVDRGTDFALSPATPPDIAEGERVRYGASQSVPSRFDEPSTGMATVVLLATDYPVDLERVLTGLRAGSPVGTSVVIVADAPSPEQADSLKARETHETLEAHDALASLEARETHEAHETLEAHDALASLETHETHEAHDALASLDVTEATAGSDGSSALHIEIIWTSERLGHAAATNIGLRRATASVVILLDTDLELTGDVVTPLVHALEDPSVAIAGGWGTTSTDLRHFEDAPAGDVDAIEGYPQAFRRFDAAQRGPLDERFRFGHNLDVWWSLVLRDGGEEQVHRQAVRLAGLPVVRHERRGAAGLPDADRDRQSKRSPYWIIDRFGWRRDLLIGGA